MKKNMLIVGMMTILMMGLIGPASANWNYDESTSETLIFSYGVSEGDELVYTLSSNLDIGFSNDSVYDVIDAFILDNTGNESDTAAIFGFINELAAQNYKMKFVIGDMYSHTWNESWTDTYNGRWETDEDGYELQREDRFNGSLRMDVGDGNGFVLPTEAQQVLGQKVWDIYNSSGFFSETELEFLYDDMTNTSNDDTNYDNFDFYSVQAEDIAYYMNGTMIPDPWDEDGEDGPDIQPVVPGMDSPNGLPFILPSSFNFNVIGTNFQSMVDYEMTMADEENLDLPFSDFAGAKSALGIGTFSTTPRSMAFAVNFENMNLTVIEQLIWGNETTPGQLEGMLNYYGVYNLTGSITAAVEYSEDMTLASLAMYIDAGIELNTTDLELPLGPEDGYGYPTDVPAPWIQDELSISGSFTVTADGVAPPSIDDIQEGNVGEERIDGSPGIEIPGYPLWIMGVVSAITAGMIIQKKRH